MNYKIVTICGSMKFRNEMMMISEKLELEQRYVVIQCIYGDSSKEYNEFEMEILSQLHFEKIKISDAIYVVNINGYIGEATKKEIEFAKSLNKEILYLEPLN